MSNSTFCWYCGGLLRPGFVFSVDPLGNEVRVHKGCEGEAEYHPVTAQESERPPQIDLWEDL